MCTLLSAHFMKKSVLCQRLPILQVIFTVAQLSINLNNIEILPNKSLVSVRRKNTSNPKYLAIVIKHTKVWSVSFHWLGCQRDYLWDPGLESMVLSKPDMETQSPVRSALKNWKPSNAITNSACFDMRFSSAWPPLTFQWHFQALCKYPINVPNAKPDLPLKIQLLRRFILGLHIFFHLCCPCLIV